MVAGEVERRLKTMRGIDLRFIEESDQGHICTSLFQNMLGLVRRDKDRIQRSRPPASLPVLIVTWVGKGAENVYFSRTKRRCLWVEGHT